LIKETFVAFGLSWFVIYLLPVYNLRELNQPMAEHWLYIPMVGLSLALGAALNSAFIRFSRFHLVPVGVRAGIAIFLIFAALVVREKTKIYQDEESFLLAAIRANPKIPGLYSNLGAIYLAKQNIPRAKDFFSKALNLDPNDFLANYLTGFLFHQGGYHEEARIYLEKVVRYNAVKLYELLFIADAWEMLGDKKNALFYYRKALDLNPQSVQTQQKLAILEKSLQSGTASPPFPP
jgi:tetratricopeptide (TPR) repeat protein